MKTRDGSRILHPDQRMKTSICRRTRGPRHTTRLYPGFRRTVALVAFVAMIAATFYSASSASVSGERALALPDSVSNAAATGTALTDRKDRGTNIKDVLAEMERGNASPLKAAWLSHASMPQTDPPPPAETIATFAPDCETPKTSFALGETVCVRVGNAPLGPPAERQIAWVGPDGFILQATDVTPTQQGDTFVIPTSATTVFSDAFSTQTLNNRGTWRVSTIATSDATLRSAAEFVVSDPVNPAVDLALGVNQVGTSAAPSGGNVAFTLEVTNSGPNAAQNVELRNPVPADATFVSITQSAGPAFTCADPGAGNTGTTICSGASLAKDDRATFTVIYRVADGIPNNTTISDSATVTNSVPDLRGPNNTGEGTATVGAAECVISCPTDITMGNDHDAYGAFVTYPAPTSTGSCGNQLTTTPASGSFFGVGTTTVTVAGSSGSPCSFNVTINDTQAPVISCPADITRQESSSGSGSAIVNYAPPSVTENDPAGAAVTCDHASGSSFPVGETTVTCTATDAAGNQSEACSFKVTVEGDASACSLSCPADITVDADAGACSAVVHYDAATASTECGTVSYSHASDTAFPVGTTIVTVTTSAGRSCSFRVTVRDTQAPTITPPNNIVVSAASSACQAVVNPGTATATDNCSGVTVGGVRDDGEPLNAPYPVGTTTITWTATDGAGNTKTADQTVKVKDSVPPVVNLVPNINLVAPADSCQVEVPEVLDLQPNSEGLYGTASDNCAGPERLTIVQRPAAGTLVSAGNYQITVTVYDGDPDDLEAPPNKTEKTTTLHVIDNTPPVIALNGANPMTVECHTAFTNPGATATDACAGSFAATSSGTVNANTPGTYTLTYTASDPSGNAATPVTRTVNVVDTQRPTITLNGANPMTVECHTTFTNPGATATDACAGSVPVTSTGSVNANVPGTYTLTYNATDPAGNAAITVTRTVNVVDTIAPTITLNGQNITLWPPNHQYINVTVSNLVASASDGCDSGVDLSDVFISKVTSDEVENGNGDGNTSNDIVIAANCKSVQLRSERDGGGNGRVYTITFKVRDAAGNTTTATAKVTVPKNQGNNGAAVDSGVHYTVTSNCP
jgi:uncharacterized repeat protein (TIGR01451 family)